MKLIPFGFRHIQNKLVYVSHIKGKNPHGPAITFIHGLAATSITWNPLIHELQNRASRFIVFDLLGHGLSRADAPLSFKEVYESARDLLIREIEPGERTILIGNSLGGAFAMKIAMDHPTLIDKAILISPAGAPFPTSAYDVLARFLPKNISEAKQILHAIFVKHSLKFDLLSPAILASTSTRAFHSLIKSMLEYDTDPDSEVRKMIFKPEDLQNCKVPIQFIWGKKDAVLPEGMRQFFDANLPPTCERIYPEDFGHCPQIEMASALAPMLSLD